MLQCALWLQSEDQWHDKGVCARLLWVKLAVCERLR